MTTFQDSIDLLVDYLGGTPRMPSSGIAAARSWRRTAT
jgi:hypothetical protein